MKALITGGCGFVGRHFAKELLDHDYAVTIVDDLSTGLKIDAWPLDLKPARNQHLSFYEEDLRNYMVHQQPDFDLIIHCAAVVGGRLLIEKDPLQVATDLAIDAMFFHWLTSFRKKATKIIYFSSSAAYPIAWQTKTYHKPLSEELINVNRIQHVPDMTYGWSKLTGEMLSQLAVKNYGLDVVIYRPFSGYGEDQALTYPFPSIMKRVAQKENPISIWGSGDQERDFIHIDDIVNAVMLSYQEMEPGTALNLGTGKGISFKDLATLACHIAGHKATIVSQPSQPEGVFSRVADCKRMFAYYRPTITLDEGIRRALKVQEEENVGVQVRDQRK